MMCSLSTSLILLTLNAAFYQTYSAKNGPEFLKRRVEIHHSHSLGEPSAPTKDWKPHKERHSFLSLIQQKKVIAAANTTKESAVAEASLNVWPKPKSATQGKDAATVSSQLQFTGDVSDPLVKSVVDRYKELLFPHETTADGDIKNVNIKLGNKGGESYMLEVAPSGIQISAEAPVGVQYALETLSQLVAFDFDQSHYVTQPVLPLKVEDTPRYAHRGLLIDTSRHFLSLREIKRLIRSLSYAKLNRLHWHVTDAQSFPIASRVEPSLASLGAWSKRERYTLEDVKEVVRSAREHGITVVPEFDMPGHTASWGKARPDLLMLTTEQIGDANSAALNPQKEETFSLIQKLLKDWLEGEQNSTEKSEFFDTPMVHLGTDEVPYTAWLQLGDSKTLFNSFVERATKMAQGMGKEVVLWEEAFKDGSPPNDAIIQVWLDSHLARQATDAGHRVILSQGWYLDHLGDTWQKMYSQDPVSFVAADKSQLMIGGEGCMWGETVDGGDLEQTVWPRLGAIAERLWSSSNADVNEAQARLASFRCLLLERGIPSGTLSGPGRSTPPGPGSCSEQ